MIPFNQATYIEEEEDYISLVLKGQHLSGGGHFSTVSQQWFERELPALKTLLTPSCTHALEMGALLIDIQEGDEVIMPSYTFVSTANAFVLRGARVVFVDIRPDTMNIDERKIEEAITSKTKAIVPVHYAGVACEMDIIMDIANRYGLYVIEDAAQGMLATYKGKALGTIGHIGCYSFHETKNFTSGGEGGLLIINDRQFIQRAEIIQEKGTNRSQFFRGEIDRYTWVDIGSSYLMSELQAAYLYGQLMQADKIHNTRINLWNYYYETLYPLKERGYIELAHIPKECEHNGHIFYIKTKDQQCRNSLLKYLKEEGIMAIFHYIPLHSSYAGQKFGRFDGMDTYTTIESEKLIRLPIFDKLQKKNIFKIINDIFSFYNQ